MKHQGKKIWQGDKYAVIQCTECGFSHLDPLPTGKELNEVYNEYYTEDKPNYIKEYEEDREWHRLWNRFKNSLFNKFNTCSEKTVLDIGCGPGLFLEDSPWEATGIEPNKTACSHANSKGLNALKMNLDQYKYLDWKSSAIHMSETLEHFLHPIDVLKTCRDFLNDNGLIFILVPNDFNPLQIGDYWIAPPAHINYFDCTTLRKLLYRNGYDIILEGTTYPMEMFRFCGADYIIQPELGRACHKSRMKMELKNFVGMQKWYTKLAKHGIGREAWVLARKSQQ